MMMSIADDPMWFVKVKCGPGPGCVCVVRLLLVRNDCKRSPCGFVVESDVWVVCLLLRSPMMVVDPVADSSARFDSRQCNTWLWSSVWSGGV